MKVILGCLTHYFVGREMGYEEILHCAVYIPSRPSSHKSTNHRSQKPREEGKAGNASQNAINAVPFLITIASDERHSCKGMGTVGSFLEGAVRLKPWIGRRTLAPVQFVANSSQPFGTDLDSLRAQTRPRWSLPSSGFRSGFVVVGVWRFRAADDARLVSRSSSCSRRRHPNLD